MIMKTLLAFLMLTATSFTTKTANTGYKVGDTAVDFKLKNVDGKTVSLANYSSAKGYIVVFTCNHCPYAKAYETRVQELDKMYAAKGFPVIAISPSDPESMPQDSPENMKKHAVEKKYSFPYLADITQETSKAFGAKATPTVYVLQKTARGNIVKYVGSIDDDTEGSNIKNKYAENAVNALLTGKTPAVTSTKAIGCAIKYKTAA